jgi:23S rRNA (adenine2503-C2)-methyltransferase
MTPFCGMTPEEIYSFIRNEGYERDHAQKIATSYYRKGIYDFSGMKDIPKVLREHLGSIFLSGLLKPVASEISTDKSIKYLFRTDSGKEFETVYLPDNQRKTVCVSTQSGCRMGCPFCVTGQYGFKGNLSAGEIVTQIISLPAYKEITHVVFMGMGEPMDNLHEVLKACDILTSDWGLAISPRNITVSSVGITPSVREFLDITNCNLTISLYSPFPDERAKVIPVEKAYPVSEIITMLKTFSGKKKRRLSLAYVMIENINDSDRHLEELVKLLKESQIRVNILPYHRVNNDNKNPSAESRMEFFKHYLVTSGVSASIRKSRGADISAACGLLASGLKKN